MRFHQPDDDIHTLLAEEVGILSMWYVLPTPGAAPR